MDTSELRKSGIVNKGEEILEFKEAYMDSKGKGFLSVTNRRLLFLQRPGIFSKGFNLTNSWLLNSIISVATTGLVSKKINVQIRYEDGATNIFKFRIGNSETTDIFVEKLVGAKEEYIEEITIEAKRIVIESGKKDDSIEILKKRLARGEITLEEFHQKIQRL